MVLSPIRSLRQVEHRSLSSDITIILQTALRMHHPIGHQLKVPDLQHGVPACTSFTEVRPTGQKLPRHTTSLVISSHSKRTEAVYNTNALDSNRIKCILFMEIQFYLNKALQSDGTSATLTTSMPPPVLASSSGTPSRLLKLETYILRNPRRAASMILRSV